MLTHSQRRALDRRLGAELGYNPHGQPNFRWVHADEIFFFIKHGDGLNRRDSGSWCGKRISSASRGPPGMDTAGSWRSGTTTPKTSGMAW